MSETPSSSDSSVKAAEREARERDLITVVTALVRELHPQRFRYIDIHPSSRIERDLGIDSLGRTELILRIERAFRVRLPVQTIGEAETVHDPLEALEQARPTRERTALETQQPPTLPSVPAASEARTLIEVLEWHATLHPERLHLTVLQDEATILGTLTCGELATKARNVARGLIARDILPGDRVALMLPTSIDFFVAFFGILYAGAIPVPIYPPMRLATALSRHGFDRRMARKPLLWYTALCHVAIELPRATRELAMGDSPFSRHLFCVAEFWIRTVPE